MMEGRRCSRPSSSSYVQLMTYDLGLGTHSHEKAPRERMICTTHLYTSVRLNKSKFCCMEMAACGESNEREF